MQALLGQLNLILDSFDTSQNQNLGKEDLNRRDDIYGPEFGTIQEIIDLLDQTLSEFLVSRNYGLAGIENKLIDLLVHLSWLLLGVIDCAQQNLKGNLELLTSSITHHV